LVRRGREVALRLGDDDISANFRIRDGCRVVVVEVVVGPEGGVIRAAVGSFWDKMGCFLGDYPGRDQ
jgi:hypothetical protein